MCVHAVQTQFLGILHCYRTPDTMSDTVHTTLQPVFTASTQQPQFKQSNINDLIPRGIPSAAVSLLECGFSLLEYVVSLLEYVTSLLKYAVSLSNYVASLGVCVWAGSRLPTSHCTSTQPPTPSPCTSSASAQTSSSSLATSPSP